MHDPRALIELGDAAVRALARRGYELNLDTLAELTSRRATTLDLLSKLRAEANQLARASRQAQAASVGSEDRRPARLLKQRVVQTETELRQIEAGLSAFLLAVPNLPDETVPDGGESDAVELRRVGQIPSFDFEPADHVRLGERMGILDLKRAGKISGTRFCVLSGAGAALERALASFFLDLHTGAHGYRECSVPSLVTRKAMTGTGQLPKFEVGPVPDIGRRPRAVPDPDGRGSAGQSVRRRAARPVGAADRTYRVYPVLPGRGRLLWPGHPRHPPPARVRQDRARPPVRPRARAHRAHRYRAPCRGMPAAPRPGVPCGAAGRTRHWLLCAADL